LTIKWKEEKNEIPFDDLHSYFVRTGIAQIKNIYFEPYSRRLIMVVFTVQSMIAIAIGIIVGKIIVYCAKKRSGQ